MVESKEIPLFTSDKLKKSADFTEEGKRWLSVKKKMPGLFDVERLYELPDFDQLDIDKQKDIRERLFVQNVRRLFYR